MKLPLPFEYKGYIIAGAQNSGSACKGYNKTSSVQVRKPCGNGYMLLKKISYILHDSVSFTKAIEKAKAYVDKREEAV